MTEEQYCASLEFELGIDHDKPDADKLLALAAVLTAARMQRPVNARAAEQMAAARRQITRFLHEANRRAA
jgi:hypothetical protein